MLCVPCSARIITVDDDGPADFNNIQAAIDDAKDGDTVVVRDGIYTGEGNRDINFLGKAIVVKSENGPENCIVDCNGSETELHRGFDFQNGEEPNSVVDGFTITNGYANSGGGIYGGARRATVTNCIIAHNVAYRGGGGIAHLGGTISNCVIYANSARTGGGLFFCQGKILNCTVAYNTASLVGGGAGLLSGGC
jgi:hypothetical protein